MSNWPEPPAAADGPPDAASAQGAAGRPSSSRLTAPGAAPSPVPGAVRGLRRFPVPPEYRAAAQLWLDPEQHVAPVTPQDAACTVLIRDSPRGVETYLTAHEHRSPFGPVSFPGGRVIAADDEPIPWSGLSSQEWAGVLRDDVGSARRTVVAAARTLFATTGVLLAGRRRDTTIATTGGHDWMSVREDVAAGEQSLSEVLADRRLLLRTELLRPMARWITAEFMHRRCDIRYFLVILPERQEPGPLGSRGRPGGWVSPAEVLRGRPGESPGEQGSAPPRVRSDRSLERQDLRPLLTPATVLILEDLARAPSAIAVAAHRPHLEPRMARLERAADGSLGLAVDRAVAARRR
ncbi:NUDIX hydrolase [Kocuria palustris]|uniref:NUDIX hydrolase n=1 Tax=Kocuria palustris TaxID=71999 RepID=UPI0011AA190D|nr:NUDIX hydrolase [Kocuria palustris]